MQQTEIANVTGDCKNCGAQVSGLFCPQCGQRYRKERLSINALLNELPAQWLSIDKGFFYTFFQQFRAPGAVARRYVNGERVTFTNPLTYYLMGAGVQLLMLLIMGDLFIENMVAQLGQNPEALKQYEQTLGDKAAQKIAEVYLNVVNQGYTYLGFFFMCMPFAFMLRLFSKRHRQRYNNAETLIFAFYTIGHFIMVTGLMGLITLPLLDTQWHSILSVIIYLVFCTLATRGFYQKSDHSIVASLFTLLIAFSLFLLTLMVAFIIAISRS